MRFRSVPLAENGLTFCHFTGKCLIRPLFDVTPSLRWIVMLALSMPLARADLDPHLIADPLAAEAATLTSGFTAIGPQTVTDPTGQGVWGPVIPWTPHIPVTAATLPDGRLLTFASNQRTSFPGGPEFTYSAVWDPQTGVFTEINNPRHDMFCGGTSMLPDGRVVVNGGRATTVLSSIFDFRTEQWNAIQNMNDRRWYNTSAAMPDGTVFTVSGSGGSNTAELWNSTTGWRRLTGVTWASVTSQPGYINIWHPFLMLAPNGNLFHFGPTDAMNWVTTANSGGLTASGQNVPGSHYPKEGVWAMYDEGRILIAGGGATATNNPNDTTTGISTNVSYTVNLNGTTPVVTPAAPMAFNRQFANTVVLPSGEVVVIGGNSSGIKFNDTGSILTPEIWNPRTSAWRQLANMAIPRNYHSVALLLPDGRLWAGGGGLGGADHQDAQIFTPPALFAPNGSLAVRPVITESPGQIGVGTTFTVRATPGLARFSFIRMSSVTHSMNTDLRFINLPFTESTPGVYTLAGNANSNVMLPGYWMLFGLNSQSVHSVSKIIQVNLNPALTVTNPGDQQIFQGRSLQLPISISALPGTTVSYSATGLPAGLSIHPTTGLISGTPTASPGNYWSTVRATPNIGSAVSVAFNWNVLLPNLGSGKIMQETWLGITGSTLLDLTSNPAYPAKPSERDFISTFESPTDEGDNLGRRIRGYLHPAVTGTYRFWIASDDQSRLLLSTDATPSNAVQIANAPAWTAPREWTKTPAQASAAITLVAGRRYYIEAVMKEGAGGDNLAVGWRPPGASTTEVISGQHLSPFNPQDDIVAAWYLDERTWNGTSGEVKESIGKTAGIHGTALNGAVTASVGPVLDGNPGTGRFASLNGANQAVNVPFHAVLNPADFTISAWVRPSAATSSNWRAIAVSREATGSQFRGYGLYASPDGRWTFLTGTNWTALTGPVLTAGQWTHLSASFRTVSVAGATRTGVRRIFVNGIQVAEDTATYVPASAGSFMIGASPGTGGPSDFMNGQIDEVRLYPVPLGTIDLQELLTLRRILNSSPVIASPGNLANTRGSVISRAIQASDQDGDAITYSATGLPGGLSISANSGIISGTPQTVGEFNGVLTATDPGGEFSSVSFTWSIVENLTVTPVASPPSASGSVINFNATSSGGKNPRFRWNFGDGSADTPFSISSAASYTYAGPGRYLVTVTATDDTGRTVTQSFNRAVHAALTANRPTASSAISYERRPSGSDRVWVVNPDNDSVTVLQAQTGARLAEIPVGKSPRCVAVAPSGRIWVTNADAATVSIIDPVSLAVVQTLGFPRGSRPFGIAFSPTENAGYLALENSGRLLKLDPVTGAELANLDAGLNIRHLSISSDGSRVYLSRFITPRLTGEATANITTASQGGEVLVVRSSDLTLERTLILAHSEKPDSSISSRGIPNYLGAATISPDGLSAWVPSKQDNIKRGKLRDNQDLTHDMSVRAIASRLNLVSQAEDINSRVDMDNAGMPSAIVYDPWGIYAFVALEANRAVAVIDVWNREEILRFEVGRAPQGLTISPDGRRLFVHHFMDRSVSIHEVGSLIDGGNSMPPAPVTTSTIVSEKLAPQILTGKQFFYDAKDNRLAFQEYISCASCHNDGGQDGRVWDFTGFGEGLRNTINLRGHGGTRQGPLHWSANFDEIQDFENQIHNFAGGTGLITSGTPHPPLGTPNAGRSADLDALAAYLQSLDQADPSPHRQHDGSLTPAARAGEMVFRTMDCASCHGGSEFTHSAAGNFPNIGTLKVSSGKRLGGNLTGIDIPTLRGVWSTAPYLHDGSAATLSQAITAHQGINLGPTDLENLVAYIRSVDDLPVSAPLPKTQFAGWAEVTPGADGNPGSNIDGDLLADLLEYALDGAPDSGASPAENAVTLEELSGAFSLLVRRPVGLKDVTYEAMTSPDLVSWTAAPVTTLQPAGNGIEVARFENLQSRPGLTTDHGFVRLRVTRNGQSQVTLPLGWQGISLGSSSRTLGIPFRQTPVFSSRVTGVSGNRILVNGAPTLAAGFRGFIEVSAGAFAGHRFEFAASAPGEITILATSPLNTLTSLPNLTGAQIVLCAHHTLGAMLPRDLFKGATDPAAADQLQFYANSGSTGRYELFYLLDARPKVATHQWRAFLPGGGDQGGRVIAPGEGILFKRPAAAPSSRLVFRGQVRANPFVQPLQAGLNLTASPFPLVASPASIGLLDSLFAFKASTKVEEADQFLLYQNNAFRVFYLLDHPTLADRWREVVPSSQNYNDSLIFNPTEAIVFKRINASLGYRIPLRWSP